MSDVSPLRLVGRRRALRRTVRGISPPPSRSTLEPTVSTRCCDRPSHLPHLGISVRRACAMRRMPSSTRGLGASCSTSAARAAARTPVASADRRAFVYAIAACSRAGERGDLLRVEDASAVCTPARVNAPSIAGAPPHRLDSLVRDLRAGSPLTTCASVKCSAVTTRRRGGAADRPSPTDASVAAYVAESRPAASRREILRLPSQDTRWRRRRAHVERAATMVSRLL